MRFINQYNEGDMIREVLLCKSTAVLQAKTGKNYMALTLQDKTGTVDGKVWDITNGIGNFDALDYILVEGRVTVFQGANQLNITRIRKADPGEYDEMNYIPCSERNIDEMFEELKKIIASVKEPHLNALLKSFFIDDQEFAGKFKKHSAAKCVHHGFAGGLLEHTLGVANLCNYLAGAYAHINRDLLLTAAILHDIGKMDELSYFPENDYTDDGNMLGHIFIGAEKVSAQAAAIEGFPAVLKSELVHCILAHHGEFEYGSPKKPAITEAIALSMADNLDAKMETMKELLEKPDLGNGWYGFQRILDSNIRRTDI